MRLVFLWALLLLTFVMNQTSAAPNQKIILVMGDSLSAAYNIEPTLGWVNLTQQKLKDSSYRDWHIVNGSVSGETSDGGLARLPALLKKHQPDIVILELGGNDGLRGQPVKLLQQNLQQMIELSINSGAKVLLLGMQIPGNYGARYAREFKETYPMLAQKNNMELVEFMLQGVATDARFNLPDGIHPNAAAQPIIMNTVWPSLEKMLK